MSDSESCDSSFSDLSICQEIDELINKCHDLHEHIHNSFETLQNIHSLVKNHTNINVEFDDKTCDFDEILEQLHTTALKNIEKTGEDNFGESLLVMLDNAIFL